MEGKKVPARSELPREYTWNAESVFESQESWESEIRKVLEEIKGVERFKGRLKKGPTVVLEAFEWIEGVKRRVSKVFLYAGLSHKVDAADPGAAEMFGRAQSLVGQTNGAMAFFEPELLLIGEHTLRLWIAENEGLSLYEHFLNDLFRRQAHIRSPEVEELLGRVSEPFSGTGTTAGLLTNADFTFRPAHTCNGREITVTQGTIEEILSGSDREARRTAWENYADQYLAFRNTLAGNLSTSIKQNVFLTRARRHASSLEAALFGYNIPVEVFHHLLDVFRENLYIWHRYWAIRKNALGLDTLEPYDIWAPLTKNKPKVSYRQAVDWICSALASLGEEYVDAMRKGCLEERWVDVYPNRGKTAGAFSWGTQGTHPFVVMSYTDDVGSLSTLAHELGHSMHSYLSWKHQPTVYSEYAIFAAEVASNFHQAMVRAYLLENSADEAFQISLIEEAMSNFHRYLFIMPMLAQFELEAHRRVEEGKGLPAADMMSLMADLFSEGYGGVINLDKDRVGITWATFGHLYSDYYVFQYMSGISGAQALADRVRSDEGEAVEAYLSFLKAGGSLYPLDALLKAGVDLTNRSPIEEAFGSISRMLDRLEGLLSESDK